MNFPEELKYTKDHEWLRVEGDNVYVGITAFAQGELGDIVFVDVDTEGEELEKEEVFGSVEAVKTVSDNSPPRPVKCVCKLARLFSTSSSQPNLFLAFLVKALY